MAEPSGRTLGPDRSQQQVNTTESATSQFKTWDAALIGFELGEVDGLSVRDVTAPSIDIGYTVDGEWVTAGFYTRNSDGLAQLNADLPRLLAESKPAMEAEEQKRAEAKRKQQEEREAKEKAKLESYTPVEYTDPETGKTYTFHTADLSKAKPMVRRMAKLAEHPMEQFTACKITATGVD